jgi:hypothetical protein
VIFGIGRQVVGFDHAEQEVPAGQGLDHGVDKVGRGRIGLVDILHVEDALFLLLHLQDGAGLVDFRLGQERSEGGQHGHADEKGDHPPPPQQQVENPAEIDRHIVRFGFVVHGPRGHG